MHLGFLSGVVFPKATPTEREQQVNALLVGYHRNPDFRPQKPDAQLYEVMVRNNGQISTLVIRITERFPDSRPDIIVKGPLATSGHSWVGPYGTIKGSKRLNEWNKSTSSLVDTVKEIVSILEAGMIPPLAATASSTTNAMGTVVSVTTTNPRHGSFNDLSLAAQQQSTLLPPPPQQQSQPQSQPQSLQPSTAANSHQPLVLPLSSPSPSPPSSSSSSSSSSQQQQQQQQQQQAGGSTGPRRTSLSAASKPPIPSSFPQLQTLSEAQLERVLRDPVALSATLENFAEVDSLREYRNTLRRKTLALASETLQREAELERVSRDALEAQQELAQLADVYSALLADKRRLFMTEKDVTAAAEQSVKVLEASSLRVREKVFAGAVRKEEVRDWLAEYLSERRAFYALKLKLEACRPC